MESTVTYSGGTRSVYDVSTFGLDVVPVGVTFLQTAQAVLLSRCLYYIINPPVLAASVLANTINIITFINMGVTDGMACLFLALSISDLLNCSLMLTERILGALDVFGNQMPYIHLFWLSFIFSRFAHTWHVISTLLTMFAAIQKCACVAFPLTFRVFFTRQRCLVVIGVTEICVLISYTPLLYVDSLAPYFDTGLNRTRIGYRTRDRRLYRETADYYKFAHFTCLQFIALAVTIFCVFVMTFKLREAATVRLAMTSGNSNVSAVETHKSNPGRNRESTSGVSRQGNAALATSQDSAGKGSALDSQEKVTVVEPGSKLTKASTVFSPRELRVLRSVNIVCAIFVMGTAPFGIFTSFALFTPSFDHRGRDGALYHIIKSSVNLWYFGSTAVNIFIYYHYNSKFKTTFDTLFKCFRGDRKSRKN